MNPPTPARADVKAETKCMVYGPSLMVPTGALFITKRQHDPLSRDALEGQGG